MHNPIITLNDNTERVSLRFDAVGAFCFYKIIFYTKLLLVYLHFGFATFS